MSTVSKFPTGCDCRCVSRCLPVLPAAKSRGSDWLQTVSSLAILQPASLAIPKSVDHLTVFYQPSR